MRLKNVTDESPFWLQFLAMLVIVFTGETPGVDRTVGDDNG